MTGITALGAYIPIYRLRRDEIARMWRTRATGGGQKAVAGHDEDPVTMAVAAVRNCVNGNALQPDILFFASTTAPYLEKQNAAIIASAVGMDRKTVTADFANSLKAGTTALMSALDAVKADLPTTRSWRLRIAVKVLPKEWMSPYLVMQRPVWPSDAKGSSPRWNRVIVLTVSLPVPGAQRRIASSNPGRNALSMTKAINR
ncbi:hydroxymethylglutaryl-CoA synthase family protein [Desulfosarcina cetonica]|uniref:hydroxymethylglutaryl-CoA synthase family protein n=1 Tax=Desulfosarcina cetonica TaxID=90730 RepID=UPI0006D2B450|nr:hydroxymethylglutaryl-CoA synthase family protein [Desulfosarcina cetonica]